MEKLVSQLEKVADELEKSMPHLDLGKTQMIGMLMRAATVIYCEIDGSTPESAAVDAFSILRKLEMLTTKAVGEKESQ